MSYSNPTKMMKPGSGFIPLCVIGAHFLTLAALMWLHPSCPKPPERCPVAVHTYVLQEKKTQAPVAKAPNLSEGKKEKPKTQVPTQQKPPPKLQTSPAKSSSTPRPKQESHQDKLVQLMQESLAALEHKTQDTKPLPSTRIGTLASESLSFVSTYQEKLTTFLENFLTLPEKGSVQLSLVINRQGVIHHLSIKEAASAKNRAYIETTLPSCILPPFAHDFKGEITHTFSITLTSS